MRLVASKLASDEGRSSVLALRLVRFRLPRPFAQSEDGAPLLWVI